MRGKPTRHERESHTTTAWEGHRSSGHRVCHQECTILGPRSTATATTVGDDDNRLVDAFRQCYFWNRSTDRLGVSSIYVTSLARSAIGRLGANPCPNTDMERPYRAHGGWIACARVRKNTRGCAYALQISVTRLRHYVQVAIPAELSKWFTPLKISEKLSHFDSCVAPISFTTIFMLCNAAKSHKVHSSKLPRSTHGSTA